MVKYFQIPIDTVPGLVHTTLMPNNKRGRKTFDPLPAKRQDYEVVNLKTRRVVGFDTEAEARGAIAYDGLRSDWELWQTGRDVLIDYRDSGRY